MPTGESLGGWYGIVGIAFYAVVLVGILVVIKVLNILEARHKRNAPPREGRDRGAGGNSGGIP